MRKRLLTTESINNIFTILSSINKQPKIELIYHSPYTLLVAVILSAQSTDKGVNKVTPTLFKIASTPKQMVNLGADILIQHIKSIGLFNNKAKNIIAMSKMVLDDYLGQIPDDFVSLQRLPGVGRKSAKVILNSIFSHPVIAVDTHVFRVSNRMGFCDTKNVLTTEKTLEEIIPKQWLYNAHHWLVLHGRYICKSRKPLCTVCPVINECLYKDKNI